MVETQEFEELVCYHGMWDFVRYVYPQAEHNYTFAGFDFRYHVLPENVCSRYSVIKQGTASSAIEGHMTLDAILHNPVNNEIFSYHYVGARMRDAYAKGLRRGFSKEMAAAWLIAHWWEHFMHNCQCQVDDSKPSHFRQAFIDTLLCLEGKYQTAWENPQWTFRLR